MGRPKLGDLLPFPHLDARVSIIATEGPRRSHGLQMSIAIYWLFTDSHVHMLLITMTVDRRACSRLIAAKPFLPTLETAHLTVSMSISTCGIAARLTLTALLPEMATLSALTLPPLAISGLTELTPSLV